MEKLNIFKFELTSFSLHSGPKRRYSEPKRRISAQWLKNVMLFGEMHCSRLKELDIRGGLHYQEFPLKNYLRPDSSDEIFILKRDRPIYLYNWMIL